MTYNPNKSFSFSGVTYEGMRTDDRVNEHIPTRTLVIGNNRENILRFVAATTIEDNSLKTKFVGLKGKPTTQTTRISQESIDDLTQGTGQFDPQTVDELAQEYATILGSRRAYELTIKEEPKLEIIKGQIIAFHPTTPNDYEAIRKYKEE